MKTNMACMERKGLINSSISFATSFNVRYENWNAPATWRYWSHSSQDLPAQVIHHGKEGTSPSLTSQWAGLGPMCRESKITVLRQAAFLQHVFSDLQTLPIKLLQMSCLIPTLAWQQLHFQSPIRQHCPLVLSSKMKHCGGAESRLREEQKGCKAYYRDGNAEPSFPAWTWPLHFTGPACSAWHKVFLWIPKHFLYHKSNTTSSLLPTRC